MKGLFSLRFGLSALALVIGLTVCEAAAWDPTGCAGNCLERLADCGGSEACRDAYQACVERCIQ